MGRRKRSRVPSEDGEEEEKPQNENHAQTSEEKSLYEVYILPSTFRPTNSSELELSEPTTKLRCTHR